MNNFHFFFSLVDKTNVALRAAPPSQKLWPRHAFRAMRDEPKSVCARRRPAVTAVGFVMYPVLPEFPLRVDG